MNELSRCKECKSIFEKYGFDPKDNVNKEFHKWSLKNHPDKGGDTETFGSVSGCMSVYNTCKEHSYWEKGEFDGVTYSEDLKKAMRGTFEEWMVFIRKYFKPLEKYGFTPENNYRYPGTVYNTELPKCDGDQIYDPASRYCIMKNSYLGKAIIRALSNYESWKMYLFTKLTDSQFVQENYNPDNKFRYEEFREKYLSPEDLRNYEKMDVKCDKSSEILYPPKNTCVDKYSTEGLEVLRALKNYDTWRSYLLSVFKDGEFEVYGYTYENYYRYNEIFYEYLSEKERRKVEDGEFDNVKSSKSQKGPQFYAGEPSSPREKKDSDDKCPADKVYNKRTKKCVLRNGKIGKAILEAESKKNASKKNTAKSGKSTLCPDDKIYNPDSERCVLRTGKIGKAILSSKEKSSKEKSSKTEKGKCPNDKVYNPDTEKCVLRTGKIGKKILGEATPKGKTTSKGKCPTDKVYNPDTEKCVLRTGKIGKKILGEKSKPAKATSKGKGKCPKDKVYNPDTEKCVLRTGKIGKKILAK